MKKAIWLVLFLLILPIISAQNEAVLHMFYGQGCPHCATMHSFLEEMQEKYPKLIVKEHEVYFDNKGRDLFQKMAAAFGYQIQGVPTIFVDEKVFSGSGSSTRTYLENEIKRCISEGCLDPEARINGGVTEVTEVTGETDPAVSPEKTENIQRLTIPAVLVAAVVDAINPCAFAVLIILLTTILAAKAKKRVLWAGLAFTLSVFISYYLMGLGLFSAIQASGLTHIFYLMVGFLAIILGLFNLKDYLWYGKWFVMEVPMSWRPKLKALIKSVTSVPGAFLIGFVVSLFLLPCTSGPYIVILGLLSKVATRNYALLLLLLYNFIFILPMLVITGIIYFGFTTVEKAEEWRTKRLKVLHLIAGVIMLWLGVAMLLSVYLGWL